MHNLHIEQFSCLSDNYGYLVHDAKSGETAAIDTPDAAAIKAALDRRGWTLTYIWNTHHHYDHTGGNETLKAETGCTIIGPRGEGNKIPAIDHAIGEGDCVMLGTIKADVLDVGGHTLGHIAYYFADAGVSFVGDSLFALGCGRVFEGTMAQMWQSLNKLTALPAETKVYCAHEYTLANAKFARTIDPDNSALQKRISQIEDLRARGTPTIPTTIGLERATNPFLRADNMAIRTRLNMVHAADVDVFTEIRQRKDNF